MSVILLSLLACGDPDAPPPPTEVDAEVQQAPQARPEGPPGVHNAVSQMPRGPDPSGKYLRLARSDDGLTWTPQEGVLATAASSPNLTVINGAPVVLFVEHGEYLAQVPLTGGPSTRVALDAGDGLVVDPHVVALPDGGYRLYFIQQPREHDPGARLENEVRSARSADGRTWTVEAGVRMKGLLVDPDVVPLREGGWRMFLTQDAVNVKSARSADGLDFEPEPGLRMTGGGVTSTLQVDDGWRMYFHSPGGIGLSLSDDGETFHPTRDLLVRPDTRGGAVLGVESPSVLVRDGVWWMVYAAYGPEAMKEPAPR
ncbi:MAG: hypothetical protein H6739_40665 [Alphaproteobacteria bacterium]|nr:hypothetical protein [Alphaproteobacteria bacterium]